MLEGGDDNEVAGAFIVLCHHFAVFEIMPAFEPPLLIKLICIPDAVFCLTKQIVFTIHYGFDFFKYHTMLDLGKFDLSNQRLFGSMAASNAANREKRQRIK